jgi:hypothetical protein
MISYFFSVDDFLPGGYDQSPLVTISKFITLLPSYRSSEQIMTNDKLKLPATESKDVPRQRYNMPAALLVAVVFACFFLGTNQAYAQEQKPKVIYFLSGIKDHAGPGRHEVAKDLLVLQDCINKAYNIKGVKIVTKYIDARSALNVDDIKDADALIVEASSVSSSEKRTHPLFPPLAPGERKYDKETLDYLSQLDALHKAGMGIMILHWGIAVNNEQNPTARDYYLSWFGETAMEGYTQNPLGFWIVTPIESARKNPILNGVHRWIYKDEIFSRLVVNPGDPYRTDLLMGESPETNQSEADSPKGVISPRGIASAYEKDKARGILWGGMDFHSALLDENYRRFLMNAIVWTAGIEVPAGGVKTSATQLQLAPISKAFDNYKKPDGYVEVQLPAGVTIPPTQ